MTERPPALCLAVLLTGCSVFAVPIARPTHPGNPPACRSSVVAPVADSALAAAGAGAIGVALSHSGCDTRSNPGCPMWAWVFLAGLATAVVWGGSATWGFVQTGRCRCFEEQHEAYMREDFLFTARPR